MAQQIDGIALGCIAAGGIFVYAGVRGKSLPSIITGFIQGTSPAAAANANQITDQTQTASPGSAGGTAEGTSGTPSSVQSTSGQDALEQAAGLMGWSTGAQWQALNNVEMAEAGYDATVVNQQSGALGIGQALGHGTSGTAGSLGNEYGGYGLTDSEAQAANSGNAYWQSVWMVNYIASDYGTPEAAWAHEQEYDWY